MTAITSKSIYFTHDSNAFSDPKILKLRKTYGVEGYGIYFILLEKLSASNDYHINVKSIEDLAYDMRVEDEKLLNIINNYDLFKQETEGTETFFYSPSHRLKMQYKDERADKKRLAGMARQAGLTPEEMSKQNTKAARARWDKYFEEQAKIKDMPAQVASDASTKPAQVASYALNKDKNKNAYKDKNEDKDKDKNKEEKTPSASSSDLGFSSSEKVEVNNTPKVEVYVYDADNIQEQIKKHKSKFFTDDNIEYVTTNFNEYMKNINKPILLDTYERLLYMKYFSFWLSENTGNTITNNNNSTINRYVTSKMFSIAPNDIYSLLKSVQEKSDMNKIYFQITEDIRQQLPTPIN
jgi:hypothetical protein